MRDVRKRIEKNNNPVVGCGCCCCAAPAAVSYLVSYTVYGIYIYIYFFKLFILCVRRHHSHDCSMFRVVKIR